jgi:formylglycine-generating enzyme required for sulfatase activity
LTETAAGILGYLSETEGAAAWLAEILPPESARALENSAWYRETVSAAAALSGKPPASPSPLGASLRLGALNFRELPGGSFVQGAAFPRELTIENFYIAMAEIDRETWGSFLRENPQWGRENRETLIRQGLASEGYLEEPAYPPYPSPGVPGISWHAALACCRWLTGQLPPSLNGWEVRLPTEAEWEYAAKLAAALQGASPQIAQELPRNMLGGLWEWCADNYAPLNYLPGDGTTPSPERPLKGGSWINPPGSVGTETRASLRPETSAAFVSFRPVIVPPAAH